MRGFAIWPPPQSPVSAATLAREMMAMTQTMLTPPPFPDSAADGKGRPVIVLPGFLAPDMSTGRLREFLTRQNFKAYAWTGGINLGPMPKVLRDVERQILEVADATGQAVCLIGVSLGGTTAREVAKHCPDHIARVVTLVSPIHMPVVTPLAPLAQAAALLWDVNELEALAALAEPPPVPLTALISRDDGIIDWRAAIPESSDMVEVVEISGPHMTICSNPQVQHIVADRLAKTAG